MEADTLDATDLVAIHTSSKDKTAQLRHCPPDCSPRRLWARWHCWTWQLCSGKTNKHIRPKTVNARQVGCHCWWCAMYATHPTFRGQRGKWSYALEPFEGWF